MLETSAPPRARRRLATTTRLLAIAGLACPLSFAADSEPRWTASSSVEKRIDQLLARMTVQEKVAQLAQFSGAHETGPANKKVEQWQLAADGGLGSVLNMTGAARTNSLQREAVEKSRLGIPVLFALDVIHGYRTVYPIPLAMSATWNPQLAEDCARMAAVEATSEGIRWTFSPMIDIARDARWGRITEGNGEDPYLGSEMARAWIRGYQGDSLSDPTSMVACAKHFVAYGGADGGRDYDSVDMSERTLREIYLPPFQAAVDAGVGTFMSGFNTLQGVPTSANGWTLDEILRREWGFRGAVVSDWNSVGELLVHGVTRDGADAAGMALVSGVDIDMDSSLYVTKLPDLVASGKLDPRIIDRAVARVLRIKFALGLFETPYTDESRSASVMLQSRHLELARRAAEESFVLLKNDSIGDKPALPLSSDDTVALIGPLADSKDDMFGAWVLKGDPQDVVTLRESMTGALKDKLLCAKGTEINGTSEAGFAEALAAANAADVVVMALGEAKNMSGEAASRADIGLPGNQRELLQAVVATGKPVVLVVFSGRPLALPWESEHAHAILQAWYPGVQTGPALLRTLYGKVNPSGKLTASFPRSVGQMPLYYNRFCTGRPSAGRNPGDGYITGYIDMPNTALFPFGWGLSYTSFEYSTPTAMAKQASAADLNGTGSITVGAEITNSGPVAGSETVQLYISQRGTSVVRPMRELKGFRKIHLKPGETRRVEFKLGKEQLAIWNLEMKHVVEPCELTVWVGPHSAGGQSTKIEIEP